MCIEAVRCASSSMIALASGISYVDLLFQDTPRVIATAVLSGPLGVALVDPGPTSSLGTLKGELNVPGSPCGTSPRS